MTILSRKPLPGLTTVLLLTLAVASAFICSLVLTENANAKTNHRGNSPGHSKMGSSGHGKHHKSRKYSKYRYHHRPKIGIRRPQNGYQRNHIQNNRYTRHPQHFTRQHKKIHNRTDRRYKRVIGRRVHQNYYTSYRGANYSSHISRNVRTHYSRGDNRHEPGWSSKRFHARIGVRVKNKPWRGRFQAGATNRTSSWMKPRY